MVDAADSFGAFNSNIYVYMDADEGGFNTEDYWRNDISGEGRLEKSGTNGSVSMKSLPF
ncbi:MULTISPECIES: hypothetical protein [Vibrio]|uniref:hypothetical protein n=1 Tax=Vibrio TaxID=662 RepID=UPI0003571AE1|nr:MULTISPECIES: hypothetical protein [Vibrio]EPM42291.1 hypothetical protein M272_02235 [Vibrio natriegens NBRC 15636 = ATCC 14048 = DSM 759]MDX6026854.1 hypothetical protein [Vibrio natriegens NBRC 15636 = ATCC 14048 = DSM 759]UUI12936.1 hypothetical protein NP431_06755 [Vibrio natriegens]WRS49733.1 hypothetical protein VER99_06540 [Vibrio natriegens NBRC 15636 = ATCC 14048 = DSM 759]